MITILAAAAILSQPAGVPSVVGEWRAWRITMGDYMVDPPTLEKGVKLFLTSNGKYTFITVDGKSVFTTSRGTFSIEGNKIHIERKGRDFLPPALLYKNGVLREGSYLMGMGSFVYSPPGKAPAINTKSDKDWPTFDDWGSLGGS